jgi:phage repressor protein C with HTH and peptisase S24 domain
MNEGSKEFAEYFNKLLEEKEPRALQVSVAEKLGVSQGTLSKLRRGAMIPSDDLARKIAKVWDLDMDSMMESIYNFRKSSNAKYLREVQKREEESKKAVEVNLKPRLPITAAAGVLSDYLGGILAHECEQMPVVRSIPDYDFTMLVKGNSMEPKYEGGDEIACKKVESLIEWGKTYVLATRDGAVLKRLYQADNGVRCVSYNHEEYPDFIVNGDDILGVYRVVGLIRV